MLNEGKTIEQCTIIEKRWFKGKTKHASDVVNNFHHGSFDDTLFPMTETKKCHFYEGLMITTVIKCQYTLNTIVEIC